MMRSKALADMPIIEAALDNAKAQLQDSEARRRQEIADLQQQIGEIMAEKNTELHDVRITFEARLAEAAQQNAEKDALLRNAVEAASAKDAENRRLQSQFASTNESLALARSDKEKAISVTTVPSSKQTSPSKSSPKSKADRATKSPLNKTGTPRRRSMVRVPIRNGSSTRLVPMEEAEEW